METSNTSYTSSNSGSHTVNLPASIANGDLLLAFFASDGADAPFVNWPAGWTEIFDDAGGSSSISVAYRNADGGEGASITVTTDTNRQTAHNVYRISNHDSGNPPEVSSSASGSSANPDPDSLSPGGGSDDYLWFAACSVDGDSASGPWDITNAPTNYGDLVSRTSASATFGCTLGVARREYTGASDNPSTFTASGSDGWIALTVAVYPA